MPDAVTFSAIFLVGDHTQALNFAAEGVGHIRGSVGRAIVDNNDLCLPPAGADICRYVRERHRQAQLLIKDGITMESSGGTELIVAVFPSSRARREVERSGKAPVRSYERYHGSARSAANPDSLHPRPAQPFFRLRRVAQEAVRARRVQPLPREWRRTKQTPANQAFRRRSAREHCYSRGARDARRLPWQARRGTPR